ncbi:hypothetical protein L2E82_03385 [Cichorium intybus]|uniref:Uncharacterized protein n=1 Tax=Cichorium intybus TaxID=13427 RepID=A0ACB9H4F0_CICIN|nr:hypothetical protein L2E82_03385 [Cichorium intybus]
MAKFSRDDDIEWQRVRRRRDRQQENKDNKIVSFFVSGLPRHLIREDLGREFARFGKVVDVYAAGRKAAYGKFFAFVRFKDVLNVEHLEQRLQGIKYQNFLLNVNTTRFDRKENERDVKRLHNLEHKANNPMQKNRQQWSNRQQVGRSFVDVVTGKVDYASHQCITLKTEDREEGEFVPEDPTMEGSPPAMETPRVVPANYGECAVGTMGNVSKPVIDSRTEGVGSEEYDESVFAFNAPRGEEVHEENRDFPSNTAYPNDGSLCGLMDNGPHVDHNCNTEFVVGCQEKFNGLEKLIPSGCFGLFLSRTECLQTKKGNILLSAPNSNSKSESYKSTEGRIKRRRIRAANSPRFSGHSDRPCRKSIDLNVNPQEIRATLEVGKEIGVQFNQGNNKVEQLLVCGERNLS